MTIRSFRIAFEFERRIFKLDRWRLPVAYGVPLRSIGYAVALVVGVALASRLPLAGNALGTIAAPVKFVVGPSVGAYLLTRIDVDGRPAHAAAAAWLRHLVAPRRLVAFRAAPATGRVWIADVAFAPDEHSSRCRRAVVDGPARVLVRYPVSGRRARRSLTLRQTSDRPMWRGREIVLRERQRIVVR